MAAMSDSAGLVKRSKATFREIFSSLESAKASISRILSGSVAERAISCSAANVFASAGDSTGHSSMGTICELSGKK
jgi:hypothetical protein